MFPLIVAVINYISSLSVLEASSLFNDVRHAWLERGNPISCEPVGTHLRLGLVELKFVLQEAFIVVVAQREAGTRA